MSFLSSIGHIVSHVVHSVAPVLGDVAPIAGAVLAPFTGGSSLAIGSAIGAGASVIGGNNNSGSMVGDIASGVESLIGSGKSNLGTFITDVGSGLEKLFGHGFTGFLTEAGSILKSVNHSVDSVSKSVNDIIGPISQGIHELTSTVQHIDDGLIKPITTVISTTEHQVSSLLTSIHSDLHSGIQGLLKLPQDLSNSLTSIDASFGRATQQLGEQNASIVKDELVPGLGNVIGSPLEGMNVALTTPVFTEDQQAAFKEIDNLHETQSVKLALDNLHKFEGLVTQTGGFFGPIVSFIWRAIRLSGFLASSLEPVEVEILQNAKATNPVEVLGEGQVIEALRRGLLKPLDAEAELLKQGISKERQQVLYDLAQYIFGPTDTVRLKARGIIDANEYDTLMDQNNLSIGQADSLRQLMEHILGPGDIASAYARGYITSSVADELYDAALIPEQLKPIIPELERTLIDPSKMIAMQGRQQVAADNFLGVTLNSPPPEAVKSQYDRTQQEAGADVLDWLAHWDIPAARWWVTAYFRGLRTRTEVERAFTARNIPEELWDDIFNTEEELPPVWLVPDVVASGVWSEEQAVPTLQKLGFSEENARVLYQYGLSKSKSSKATTAADLQKVSLGNARKMLDDGLIDGQAYESILMDHGYSADAAQLTRSLAEFELARTERKNQADLLLEGVKLGELDKSQAESQLYNLGFNSGEVAKYLDKIESARVLNRKLPSETHVKDALKKGLIDPGQAVAQLELLGYDSRWANLIYQTW